MGTGERPRREGPDPADPIRGGPSFSMCSISATSSMSFRNATSRALSTIWAHSISLMSLGETVSDINGKIIDETIQKSKELELQKEVLRDKEAGYNRIKEEIEKGDNNVL